MDWLSFAGSILGGLIGGFFTFVGVLLTIKHDDKKKKLERIEKANQEKPYLDIISYKDCKDATEVKDVNHDCGVLALGIIDFKEIDGRSCFFYNKDALDSKNLVFIEYQFVNSGLTTIQDICVASNLPRFMALIEFERKDIYINERFLNYGVWSNKRYIKFRDTFKLRVYYVKGQIPTTNLGSPELIIWLRDISGFVWKQTLNAPANEIEMPKMSNNAELNKSIDIEKAIECFKDPSLW